MAHHASDTGYPGALFYYIGLLPFRAQVWYLRAREKSADKVQDSGPGSFWIFWQKKGERERPCGRYSGGRRRSV